MDRRIRVPKDKEELLVRLVRSDEYPNGPFRRRADVMTFAAAYGYSKGERQPFGDSMDPIRFEVFERQGHDLVFYLLAFAVTKDPNCLADTDEAIDKRAVIFEEYANGGLGLLQHELQGIPDPLGRLLLILEDAKPLDSKEGSNDLDLRRFLSTL